MILFSHRDVYVPGNYYKSNNSVICCCFLLDGDFVMGNTKVREASKSIFTYTAVNCKNI
jgi:hypothetical protein